MWLLLIFCYFSHIKGGVDAKELFHLYIMLWIQDKRLSMLEVCKLDKVHMLNNSIVVYISFLLVLLDYNHDILDRKQLDNTDIFNYSEMYVF